MQQELISRNEDLKRLRDEGYEVEIRGGYLLIHHIPYPKSLDSTVTEKTYKPVISKDCETVFYYIDTNSSRAAIDSINSKFKGQKIAIIGMGGTGSYILDLVAKTAVMEIHLFDGDDFNQHNAFRAPGAASLEDLEKHMKKTDYLENIYSKMHRQIVSHGYFIDACNIDILGEMSFVFVSIDNNSVRKMIVDYLLIAGIPFIDVGVGITEVDGRLGGLVRTTVVTKDKTKHVETTIPMVNSEEEAAYSSNIQIAELNALNACFAVIRWKKICGFYNDFGNEFNTVYSVSGGTIQACPVQYLCG